MPLDGLSKKLRYRLLCSIWIFLNQSLVIAEEIKAYNLTGVEGHVGLQYLKDDLQQPQSHYRLRTNQEEVSVLTHSYVYHPNFLKMDLGGGLLLTQNELDTSLGSREYDEELYNLTAYLRFLENKPYPVTLYYDRGNPSVSNSLTERFVQQTEKYGVNAAVREPVLPFAIEVDAYRQTSEGRGSTQIVDEKTDQVFMRAYRAIGKDGYGQLTYQVNRRESASGSQNLPIQKTETEGKSTSLDTHFKLGAKNQIDFTNIISYFTQDVSPKREEVRVTPNITWHHSDETYSYYRFDYLNSEIDELETENTSSTIGASTQLTERLNGTAEANSVVNKTTGLESTSNNIGGRLSYTYPLSFGKLLLGAGTRYASSERKTSAGEARVIGEQVRLDGLNRVALTFQYVISVRVWNQARTQEYLLNSDFILTTIGSTTYIERKSGGNITDGEIVLVDYSYETGGDVVFTSLNQNYQATLELYKYYSLNVSYSETDFELEGGQPTIPLNPVTHTITGARADIPFRYDTIRVGGEVVHEDHNEEVSPYDSDSQEVFFQTEITRNIVLYLLEYRLQRDNLYSDEDVDLKRQIIRLSTRPWPRSTLSFEVSNEKDTGGSFIRSYKRTSIIGEMRIRKLVFTVDGRVVEESFGSSEQRHTIISAALRREF